MAVLDSMSHARSAIRADTLSAGTDAITRVSDFIYRSKSTDLNYRCAAELLRGYQESKNIYIAVSAMRGVRFYEALINFDGELVALLKFQQTVHHQQTQDLFPPHPFAARRPSLLPEPG